MLKMELNILHISRPETNENLQDVESIFNDGTDDFSYFNQGFFIFDQPEEYKRAVRPLLMEDRVLAVEQKVKKSSIIRSQLSLSPPHAVLLRQDDGEDGDTVSD